MAFCRTTTLLNEKVALYYRSVRVPQRKGLGIVHGTSQSGETLYLEPAEVVAKSNEIRETEAAIQREIRRIMVLLSGQIGGQAEPLQEGLRAATTVDLAVPLVQAWDSFGVGAFRPVVKRVRCCCVKPDTPYWSFEVSM